MIIVLYGSQDETHNNTGLLVKVLPSALIPDSLVTGRLGAAAINKGLLHKLTTNQAFKDMVDKSWGRMLERMRGKPEWSRILQQLERLPPAQAEAMAANQAERYYGRILEPPGGNPEPLRLRKHRDWEHLPDPDNENVPKVNLIPPTPPNGEEEEEEEEDISDDGDSTKTMYAVDDDIDFPLPDPDSDAFELPTAPPVVAPAATPPPVVPIGALPPLPPSWLGMDPSHAAPTTDNVEELAEAAQSHANTLRKVSKLQGIPDWSGPGSASGSANSDDSHHSDGHSDAGSDRGDGKKNGKGQTGPGKKGQDQPGPKKPKEHQETTMKTKASAGHTKTKSKPTKTKPPKSHSATKTTPALIPVATKPPSKPALAVYCETWHHDNVFLLKGTGWDDAKVGSNGRGLFTALDGCHDLENGRQHFQRTQGGSGGFEWQASGRFDHNHDPEKCIGKVWQKMGAPYKPECESHSHRNPPKDLYKHGGMDF